MEQRVLVAGTAQQQFIDPVIQSIDEVPQIWYHRHRFTMERCDEWR